MTPPFPQQRPRESEAASLNGAAAGRVFIDFRGSPSALLIFELKPPSAPPLYNSFLTSHAIVKMALRLVVPFLAHI
ncbi:unnamed protein product [Strongylus vulgaris]|uniref:Uncharacterized protein n=1 Tax=Strongylus vulgaris TaxID=40348 RepID=A0A3P7JQU7_STRVU|nr:unnamed protein product [Strongylus vulgaris]